MPRNLIRKGIRDCLEPVVSEPVELRISQDDIQAYIKQLPRGFALGTSAAYIFNFASQKFLFIDKSFTEICGYETAEFLNTGISDTFSKLLHPEQGLITTRVHQACYHSLINDFAGRVDVHVNMDYAIQTKNGDVRRMLSQFMPILWKDKSLVLVGGFFTDITHLHNGGQPVVNISCNGRIVKSFTPYTQDLVKERLTEYTIRELEILKRTSNGYSTEEIAEEMNVSKATIYAHRRNILAKSEHKSITKLIESLRFKGILSSLTILTSSIADFINAESLIISLI